MGVTALVVVVTTFVTMVLLACSDYTLEASIYLQLVSLLANFLLFSAVVLTQFFAAASDQFGANRSYLLVATGGLAATCALYFFIANGLVKSRVRAAITCRTDPVLKNKLAAHTPVPTDSGFSSRNSPKDKLRRAPIRLTDDMNLDYVDHYLGYPHTSPVPLAVLGQAQAGHGLVRGESPRKNISDSGAQMFNNPLYGLSFNAD